MKAVLVQAHAAGVRIALDPAGTDLLLNPKPAVTPAVRALVADHKPEVVAALAAVRTEQGRIATLLRTLRHTRSLAAPAGVTLALNPDHRIVAQPSRRLVPPAQAAEIVALLGPLGDYLLLRDLWAKAEVQLRAEPMRRQLKAWDDAKRGETAAPSLYYQRLPERRLDRCGSCGGVLAHDPGWDGTLRPSEPLYGRLTRCTDCRAAVALVLPEGRTEVLCWCGHEVHRYQGDGAPVCLIHDEQAYCPACFVRAILPDYWVKGNRNVPLHRACGQCGERERERGVA